MKKLVLCLVICVSFFGNASAQIKKVNIDILGEFEVVVKVGDGSVTVNSTGEITDIDINGNTRYYSYNDGSYRSGKLSGGNRMVNVGGIMFNVKGGN